MRQRYRYRKNDNLEKSEYQRDIKTPRAGERTETTQNNQHRHPGYKTTRVINHGERHKRLSRKVSKQVQLPHSTQDPHEYTPHILNVSLQTNHKLISHLYQLHTREINYATRHRIPDDVIRIHLLC